MTRKILAALALAAALALTSAAASTQGTDTYHDSMGAVTDIYHDG
jgi:hypothetical protein